MQRKLFMVASMFLGTFSLYAQPFETSLKPSVLFDIIILLSVITAVLIASLLVLGTRVSKLNFENLRIYKEAVLVTYLKELLDFSESFQLILNKKGEIIFINSKALECLGYIREEATRKNWFDTFIPERYREKMKEAFLQLESPDYEPLEYIEYPVLTKSGAEIKVLWHTRLVRDFERLVFMCSGEEISFANNNERIIASSKNYLKTIMDTVAESLAVLDDEGKIISVNKSWKNSPNPYNFGIGVNFLERFESHENEKDPGRKFEIISALKNLLSKGTDKMIDEYFYSSPKGVVFFKIKAARFEAEGKVRVLLIQEIIDHPVNFE